MSTHIHLCVFMFASSACLSIHIYYLSIWIIHLVWVPFLWIGYIIILSSWKVPSLAMLGRYVSCTHTYECMLSNAGSHFNVSHNNIFTSHHLCPGPVPKTSCPPLLIEHHPKPTSELTELSLCVWTFRNISRFLL